MLTTLLRYGLLILASLFAIQTISQPLISYTSQDGIVMVGGKATYLEDTSGKLTLDEIRSQDSLFISNKALIPNFGNTQSVFWCRFVLHNQSADDLYLEFRKAMFDEVEFFYPDSSGYLSTLTGTAYPRNTRDVNDNFFIFIVPKSDTPQTYFLRVKSISNISFPLSVGSARHMFSKHRDEEFLYGLYIGLILTLILYNFFILIAVRDRTYFYYIAYLALTVALYDLSAIGFGTEYLWHDWIIGTTYYTVSDVFIGLAVFVNLLFLSTFLDLRNKLPRVHSINRVLYGVSIAVVVVNLLTPRNHLPFTQLLIIVSSLYNLFIIALAYAKNLRRSRFLLVGWSLYILSVIAYELYILGIIPYSGIILNAIPIGSSLEALFFSFALADRIRELRVEKLKAQEETLTLMRNQNNMLERIVHERTQEISAQNEEMAAQNEELLTLQDQVNQQNESLERRNTELEDARSLIEKQHHELKVHAESLEEGIRKKASDLVETNNELIRQNNQLQQFSFITAHNLRAPVARVLGLINVLELSADETEKQKILQSIYQTGTDLDQVIKDLTQILDIRKGSSEKYETIKVFDTVEHTKALLQSELERSNVQLKTNIHLDDTVYGLKPYLESILYNLMNNAIKYRAANRLPLVTIASERHDNQVKITFRDNGLGIDLTTHGDKVFGMYKRFHFHTEGKGLGLHLVKTQVEAMGGSISVASEVDAGTTFEIVLPAVPEK